MSTTKQITIFIAEDHLVARMGLRMLLEQSSQFSVVGEAEDGDAAIESIRQLKPDVVMMDLGLPKVDGTAATEIVKRELPDTKILIFTKAEDEDSIFAALKAGADGYCLKTITGPLLSSAIHSVLNGAAWLDPGIANKVLRAQSTAQSPAEKLTASKVQLLSLVEKGNTVEQIAAELKVNDALVNGLLHELLAQLKGDGGKAGGGTKLSTPALSDQGTVRISPGDIIGGHYRVDSLLGRGGMGCVYKASHDFIDRKVAIKTLHEHLAEEQGVLNRFKIEAEANSSIVHPNLVTIYDFGLLQGKVPYIVMELLEGVTLADMLDRVLRLNAQFGKHILGQVCDALAAVHEKGIVHRDLKPSNIMVLGADYPYVVKIVDFGIAKILDQAKKGLTETGQTLGSPAYMSPEQCYGKPVDHRSDLYSLGCVMYEAYTGAQVFEGESAIEMMMKHVNEPPPREPLESAGVSESTINIIYQMLEKKPENRPASASEVKNVLLYG